MRNPICIAICILLTLFSHNAGYAQCRLDKSHWKVYWSEEFREPNVTALLNNGHWVLGGINSFDQSTPNNLAVPGPCGQAHTCTKADAGQIEMTGETAKFKVQKADPFPFTEGGVTYNCIGYSSKLTSKYNELNSNIASFKPGFLYGMFEIRCKLPAPIASKNNNLYPAFWLSPAFGAPEHDVFEYIDGTNFFNSTGHSTGYNTPKDIHGHDSSVNWANEYFFPYRPPGTNGIWDEFHTWTLVITPEEITYFFDGKELKTYRDGNLNSPIVDLLPGYKQIGDFRAPGGGTPVYDLVFRATVMQLIVNNSFREVCNDPPNADYGALEVDYIRVYKPDGYVPYTGIYNDNSTSGGLGSYWQDQVSLYASTPYRSTADWVSNTIQPFQYHAADDSLDGKCWLQGLQGGGKFMYKGKDDFLWSTYWSAGDFYNGPVSTKPKDKVDADIALANNGNTTFYRYNGNIYSVLNSVYTKVTQNSDVRSDIVVNAAGDKLYYINILDRLVYAEAASPYWHTYVISPPLSPSRFIGDVYGGLAVDPNDFTSLYYITRSHDVALSRHTTTSDFETSILTSSHDAEKYLRVSKDNPNPTDLKQLFYQTSGTTIRTFSQSAAAPGSYTAPADFSVHMYGEPSATTLNNVSSDFLISPDNTNAQYYFVGVDRKPWVVYGTNTGFNAVPIDNNQKIECCLSLIEFGQTPANTPHLAWIGYDNRIRTMQWLSPCENLNPHPSPDGYYKTIDKWFTYYGSPGSVQRIIQPRAAIMDVYPNPTTGVVTISIGGLKSDRATLTIKNVEGAVIQQLYNVDNTKDVSVDLSKEPSGIYFINVVSDSGFLSTKISKI